MAYDFSTLDNHDFEKFARDLLNAAFQLDLQDFKTGKDRGIDLRYSTSANPNAVVAQAKHWLKSGYDKLYAELKKTELPKIKLLAPDRYILVTSIQLSPQQKDKLVKLLHPFINTANDIVGQEDLNKYLRVYPAIEKNWYKLWLTSTEVMQQILHKGQHGANAFHKEKILRNVQRYVDCPSYKLAFTLLEEHKYIMITGQPGVGKTTLATLLTYNYLANGHELLYVDTDISQASILMSNDPNNKQIVLFDDFLGATYLELINPKTSESALVNFLERIQLSENKYLILTTRTTIYNNAIARYEKLGRMRVDIARKEISLDNYSILDKARILQKHIYYSNLQQELIDTFVTNKNYWSIIQHANYNPRLIEFVTNQKLAKTENEQIFWQFINETLDNPKEVWKHFYLHQLSVEERLLLHNIFLQKDGTSVTNTSRMFQHAINHEITFFNHIPSINPFHTACKQLLDGTIKQIQNGNKDDPHFSFINPSLEDFLSYFFHQSPEERKKLLEASILIEQFENFHRKFLDETATANDSLEEFEWFTNLLMERTPMLDSSMKLKQEPNRKEYIALRSAFLILRIAIEKKNATKQISGFIGEAVQQYPVEKLNILSKDYYIYIISRTSTITPLKQYVIRNWNEIIYNLFIECVYEEDFYAVKTLFKTYQQPFDKYIDASNHREALTELIDNFIERETTDWVQSEIGTILSVDDWKSAKREIKNRREEFYADFDLEDETYEENNYFNDDELPNIIKSNYGENDISWESNSPSIAPHDDQNMVKEIEILFTGSYDENFVNRKSKEI